MKTLENDHRVRVTKLLIRQAFTSLLADKPIESITVKELCTLAGINRGTFYTHYQDIYELLSEIEDAMVKEIDSSLHANADKSVSPATLVEICTEVFQCLKNNSDMCTIMLGKYYDKQFVSRLLALGKKTCLESYSSYFKEASPRRIEYFYSFVSAGCIGLLRNWMAEGMDSTPQEISRMAERIMLTGIGFLEEDTDS